MRLLYFHQHFSTPEGATGIRSYEMAQAALREGHNVTMVCGSYGAGRTGLTGTFQGGRREGQVDGIDVIEFDLSYSNNEGLLKRSWTFLKYAVCSISVALANDYDVLFATSTPLTAGIPGIFARWLRGKPFVFEVRDLWPELPKAMGVVTNPILLRLLSGLEWLSYRSAHRLIGLSPGICEGIKSRGIPESRVAMVPNGCDLEIFGAEGIEPWRPAQVPPESMMAVFTGTHGQANGLDAVLDVAQVLQRRGESRVKFVLIGQGKLREALIRRATEAKLDNVVFLEPVGKRQLARLLVSAQLGMQILANVPAFYFGTSPNKFFDYIAAGLPVIINYPGWLAKLIRERQCGLTVPPENPGAFADAIQYALDNQLELRDMGKRATSLAEHQFSRKALSSNWLNWVLNGVATAVEAEAFD